MYLNTATWFGDTTVTMNCYTTHLHSFTKMCSSHYVHAHVTDMHGHSSVLHNNVMHDIIKLFMVTACHIILLWYPCSSLINLCVLYNTVWVHFTVLDWTSTNALSYTILEVQIWRYVKLIYIFWKPSCHMQSCTIWKTILISS